MKKGTYYGIDFGTTNTAIVRMTVDEYGIKENIIGEGGEYPFSSIVAIPKKSGQKILFGNDVKKRSVELSEDYHVISSIKSYLGTEKEFIVNEERYTATDITCAFLKHIKGYIRNTFNEDLSESVFAIPVDFSARARTELSKAAKEAGIKVLGFVSESSAAYLASLNRIKSYSNAVVIDWGGGTLDISILDLQGDRVSENSIYGTQFGGDDIDIELAKRVHTKLINQTGIQVSFDEMCPIQKDNIISRCEKAKISFMDYDDETISLRNYGKFGTKNVRIDYDFFKGVLTPLIKGRVLATINKAMELANKNKDSIDVVIMAGGSVNLRPFAEIITSVFGEEKIVTPEKAQWVVAKGACLVNVMGTKSILSDDIGILLSNNVVYPLFSKDKHGVDSEIKPIDFSLTEDSTSANFIFTNTTNNIRYGIKTIPTKGFLQEKIQVSGVIGKDQIARFKFTNDTMGDYSEDTLEINKLKFYYDISTIKNMKHV
ncbi:Hsp70 family protein [Clostridium sp. D43t1_170807_H7]|uniref:Hsp70 family protein n=1 Tax=Clostridium sp. D43t1_170807_H7 TaxID=2787140 RepID=UPI00189711FC|nr:Hsp70 family protein [Clostridium sp. D43t1_170807_H7]